MKNYKLVEFLMTQPAGADIKVQVANAHSVVLDEFFYEEDTNEIILGGGDTTLVMENGDEGDWLSDLASLTDPEEEDKEERPVGKALLDPED